MRETTITSKENILVSEKKLLCIIISKTYLLMFNFERYMPRKIHKQTANNIYSRRMSGWKWRGFYFIMYIFLHCQYHTTRPLIVSQAANEHSLFYLKKIGQQC